MRDPLRIERILNLIEELWLYYPDWRLGQLITVVLGNNTDVFYDEDDKLETALKSFLKQVKEHHANA